MSLETSLGPNTPETVDSHSSMAVVTEMFNIGSGFRRLFEGDTDSLDL